MKKTEELELIRLLGKVDTRMSAELYNALAMVRPQPVIELAILRKNTDGQLEILLTQRPAGDKFWPNLWHVPGTVLHNKEKIESAFRRTTEDELGFKLKKEPEFITWNNNLTNPRGHEISLVYRYWVASDFEPKVGRFFPADALPEKFIPEQKLVVQAALK